MIVILYNFSFTNVSHIKCEFCYFDLCEKNKTTMLLAQVRVRLLSLQEVTVKQCTYKWRKKKLGFKTV